MTTTASIEAPTPPEKLVTFHRLIPSARLPQRADRSAMGALPTRAFRYCEAACIASGWGYYIFPPMDFALRFDGHDVMWTYQGVGEWFPIPMLRSVQFPGFGEYFAQNAPPECAEFAPPFIAVLQESGSVQIWSGLVVRTAPGWSLAVRAPVNVARTGGCEPWEGIIETDQWFGPLFTNTRLIKTNTPIDFRADHPMLQVQPIPRIAVQESNLNNYELVPDMNQLTPDDWDAFYDTVVRPNVQEDRPRGQYAAAARKRLAAETAKPSRGG